jgi:large subunit ribosomal protein L17
MRHRRRTVKLGRTSQHRDSMLANMVCSLIKHSRITTTLAKAKAVRPLAEKLVTLGKKGGLHARRQAVSQLGQPVLVKKLFTDIAPRFQDRKGGYTRILKLGNRLGDAAPMALIEWVDYAPVAKGVIVNPEEKAKKSAAPEAGAEKTETKTKKTTRKKDRAE